MRITRLELTNFRGFEQAAVDFPEENVVVFFGENGAGKSSLIDAIAILLNQLLLPGDAIENQFEFQIDDIKVGAQKSVLTINYSFVNKERRFQADKETVSPAIEEFNLLTQVGEPTTKHGGMYGYKGHNLYYDLAEATSASSIPVLIFYPNYRDQKQLDERLASRHYLGRLETYRDSFSFRSTPFAAFEEWFRYQEDFENQEKIGRGDLNFVNPLLDVVRKALGSFLNQFSMISSTLRVKRITYLNSFQRPDKTFSLVTTKNNQELQLSQLSSGERALILLVADIARRAVIGNPQMTDPLQSAGIVLIDEIELHLHPKWQRRVIPALQETFPNIQFIIATHSPQVLSNVPNGSVFEIENFQIVPRNTYGRDNRWILEAVMDDESRPKEVQDMLDQYFAYIREGELDRAAALRNELESLIGRDEPLFHKADILTSRKERSVAS